MIRKGLAIGSAASLAVFGLATPSFGAQADTSKVSLAPADGTAYAIVAATVTGSFQLEANEAANIVGGGLSFLVEDADGVVFPVEDDGADGVTTNLDGTDYTMDADESWSRDADGVVTVTSHDDAADTLFDNIVVGDIVYVPALVDAGANEGGNSAAGYYTVTAVTDGNGAAGGAVSSFSFQGADLGAVVGDPAPAADVIRLVTRDADDNSFVIATSVADNTANELLTLTTMGEASATATVTAWVDDDNDGVIDGTEYASPARTVTWLAVDDISIATIDWTAPLAALTTSVEVTFAPAINHDQSEELDGVLSNAAGQFAAADATVAVDADGVYTFSATNNNVGANLTLDAGYVTLKTYTATGDELISTNRFRVTDNEIDDFEIDAVTGANVAQADTDADVSVREETTRVELAVKVVDADDAGIAGIPVTVSDGGATALDADAEVTVGGNDVDADDGSFDDVTITTNADGVATLVITSANGVNLDSLDLDFTAEAETDTVVVAWADADYNFFHLPNVPADDAAEETTLWLGTGSATTVSFIAYDQWGEAPAAGILRVETTVSQGDLDDVLKFSVFNSAGQATVRISDEEESEENVTAAFELQGYDSDGQTWADDETVADIAVGTDAIDGVTLTYTTAANEAVDVVIDDDAPAAEDIQTAAIEAQAWYLGDTDQALVNADGANLTGTVSLTADGAAYAGGLVTITGSSDLLFGNTNGDGDTFAYAFGSFTATLDESGEFDFTVWSNVTGEYTVTITSGGTSETATVEFNDPVDAAGAGIDDVTIDIAGPAYVMPGSTYIATITPKDAFGNAIPTDDAALEVTWDGPGLISGNLPTETGADGTVRVYILFGQNETGSGELSVTYWGLDGDMDATTDNVTQTATVTLGAAPAPAADTKVNAGSFKGYVAIYAKGHEGKRLSAKVGNDWVVVPALASNFVRVVEYTGAGYTIAVRIYIDRVLVDTITVTTK